MKRIGISLCIAVFLISCFSTSVLAGGEGNSIVSAGSRSSYVITSDGSLWGWGRDFTGSGTGNNDPVMAPINITDDVRSISTATYHRLIVKNDNTLWGIGDGGAELGNANTPEMLYPKKMLDGVSMAAAGEGFSLALKTDRTLWLTGDLVPGNGKNETADSGFIKIMDNTKYVSAGFDSAFAVREDDTLWAWGYNQYGQIGNGSIGGDTDESNIVFTPVKVLNDVKNVISRNGTTLAVKLDGSLYAWGRGGNDGIYTEKGWMEEFVVSPYKVMDNVLDVSLSDNGSSVVVLKTDNTVWGYGNDLGGLFGGQAAAPIKIMDNVRDISAGERHLMAIRTDDTLWIGGKNQGCALGYGEKSNTGRPMASLLDNIMDLQAYQAAPEVNENEEMESAPGDLQGKLNSPADWAAHEVSEAEGMGLVPGDLQGNYDNPITREEFCILAIRMIETKTFMNIDEYIGRQGLEMPENSPFTDCNNEEVVAASVLNIINGTTATTFDPDGMLTREQAAKVLSTTARALGLDIEAGYPVFADEADISDWAIPFIGYVYQADIMKGVGGNRFDPEGGYQRQQAFMTILRLFKSMGT